MSVQLFRPGIRDGNTDPLELFINVLTGEVLGNFNALTKFKGKSYTRTIEHGKAARFDAIGDAVADYYTAGTDITTTGTPIKHDEFLITIDGLLTSHAFIYDLDDAMNHYDVRGKYALRLAEALAQRYDRNIAMTGIHAARSAAKIPDGNGGSVVASTTFDSDPDALVDGVFMAAQILDEKNITDNGRYLFVRPAQYYQLIKHDKTINHDYDGAGSISKGTIYELGGFTIIKTNNLPNTNVTTDINKYNADYSKSVGLAMTEEAVGTVKLKDLNTEISREARFRAYLLIAEYALGHGVLRPECAVELSTDTTTSHPGGSPIIVP